MNAMEQRALARCIYDKPCSACIILEAMENVQKLAVADNPKYCSAYMKLINHMGNLLLERTEV